MNILNLMVVMMMEMDFINDSKVVMVSQVSSFNMNPINPFMRGNSINPCLFNVRVFKFGSKRMVFDGLMDSSKVVIESLVNHNNFVSHSDNLN